MNSGTRLPASRSRTSPRTSSRAGSSRTWPARRTRTVGTAIFFKAAMARSARYSWTNPRIANMSTIARMAMVSVSLPNKPDTRAAISRITTMVSVNCSSSMRHGLLAARSTSSFGPCSCSRRLAWSSSKPRSASVPSVCTVFSRVALCQSAILCPFGDRLMCAASKRIDQDFVFNWMLKTIFV